MTELEYRQEILRKKLVTEYAYLKKENPKIDHLLDYINTTLNILNLKNDELFQLLMDKENTLKFLIDTSKKAAED